MHLTLIRILNKNLDEMYTEIQDETQFAVEEVLATGKADEGRMPHSLGNSPGKGPDNPNRRLDIR